MKKLIALSTILNAFDSVAPQVLGLLLLSSFSFGQFSVAYLIFALSLSISLSILCDPWVISKTKRHWDTEYYRAVLTFGSIAFSLLGGIVVQLVVQDLVLSAALALCIGLATYRRGSRYFLVHAGAWKKVVGTDICSILGLVLGTGMAYFLGLEEILIVCAAWILGSLAGVSFGPYPNFSPKKVFIWFRENRKVIRSLLTDSLMMDVSAVGTPFILLPILGLQGFGIYRAVSNLSSPARMILAPMRPLIIASSGLVLELRVMIFVILSAVGFGGAVWGCLALIGRWDINIGVFAELVSYGAPAFLYVAGTVLLSVYPLVLRSRGDIKFLLLGRVFQTVVGLAAPILGYLLNGLEGSIWGFGAATLSIGLFWLLVARRIPA